MMQGRGRRRGGGKVVKNTNGKLITCAIIERHVRHRAANEHRARFMHINLIK